MVISAQLYYIVGWDPRAREYKVTYVDNNGSSTLMHGRIDGKRFIVETIGDSPIQLRLPWTATQPGQTHWRNDCSINGSPWFLVEEYLCTNV